MITINIQTVVKLITFPLFVNMSREMTKPTKWLCAQRTLRSALASAQSDQTLLSAWRKAKVLSYPLSAEGRLWSDWADAQADLSLRWENTHFVGFVMSRLISCRLLSISCDFFQLLVTWIYTVLKSVIMNREHKHHYIHNQLALNGFASLAFLFYLGARGNLHLYWL